MRDDERSGAPPAVEIERSENFHVPVTGKGTSLWKKTPYEGAVFTWGRLLKSSKNDLESARFLLKSSKHFAGSFSKAQIWITKYHALLISSGCQQDHSGYKEMTEAVVRRRMLFEP